MKKILTVFLCILMAIGVLSGCVSGGSQKNITQDSSDKISIVTTIFPEYDWVKQILGDKSDNAEVTMLLDNGVDLHSYQPTADDIIKISTCDVFIYVGGESDSWVDDALKEAKNTDMKVIRLMEVLGSVIREEEVKEGMQVAEEEGNEKEGEEEPEYDEHVWLSLKNAKVLCREIAKAMSSVDAENAVVYSENAEAYIEELTKLDEEYAEAVDNAMKDTVLFGDRFPFRYLVDDYGLNYYAAFVGCSAETEASFETITFLSRKVDELGLNAVITIEGAQHKIAETIVANTTSKNQQVISMDSMQSTTSSDVENGMTYLSIMESNLDTLTLALS